MSWSFQTNDRYHTQDTSYYCGAACAMMILNEIGVAYADLDQDDLYTSNHNHNAQPNWSTDPYGLCYTLNDRRPASFLPNFFVVYKALSEAEGTRDVVFTLYHYQVSPAILVYNCAHWNVVRGVQTDVDPASGPYTVEGFWLNNPVWYDPAPPPPHDGTDTCGSGGAHGVADEFVTYATWQTDRFNGCAYDAPNGATQWISVADPAARTIGLPGRRPRQPRADGSRIVETERIVRFAQEGIEEYGLDRTEIGARALRVGSFGEPVLVARLDRPGDYYYLSPWEVGGEAAGLVEIDARFGFFKSFRTESAGRRGLLVGREAGARLRETIDGRRIDLLNEGGRFTVYPGTYCISPTLVWKPCRESWSPHLPFHQVVIGGHVLYVRIDGRIFTQLTTGRGA
jgi:hypothetical protein